MDLQSVDGAYGRYGNNPGNGYSDKRHTQYGGPAYPQDQTPNQPTGSQPVSRKTGRAISLPAGDSLTRATWGMLGGYLKETRRAGGVVRGEQEEEWERRKVGGGKERGNQEGKRKKEEDEKESGKSRFHPLIQPLAPLSRSRHNSPMPQLPASRAL